MESRLSFSAGQWELVLGALVVTLFALIAGFVYTLSTREEVGPRYRPAVTASSLVMIVAVFSYLALVLSWLFGFHPTAGVGSEVTYVPNDGFTFDNSLRYFDWTVSVPLLTIELVAISTLTGAAALKARTTLVAASVAMIVTGFLGESVFGNAGRNHGAILLWGAISTVPFVVAAVGIVAACRKSMDELPSDIGTSFRNVALLFALTWGVYPLAYLVPVFFQDSSGWAAGRQIALSMATIVAKVGFGVLAHKIAKLRTAADLVAQEQSHDSEIWLSSVRLAQARPPVGTYLDGHGGAEPEEIDLRGTPAARRR